MVEGFGFHGFDWDAGNEQKNELKHGISTGSIEAFFLAGPLIVEDRRHSSLEERFLAMGKGPAGRWMLVSFTLRHRGKHRLLRPISARTMHRKEILSHGQHP